VEGHALNADNQSAAAATSAASAASAAAAINTKLGSPAHTDIVGDIANVPAAVGGRALSTSPASGTWDEAIVAARAGIGIGKCTYTVPSSLPGTGSMTVYAHYGTTVLKTFSVTVDTNGNVTARA
jgi:hypothetical protein